MIPLLAVSLLCTYGMIGCAYFGYLHTETHRWRSSSMVPCL